MGAGDMSELVQFPGNFAPRRPKDAPAVVVALPVVRIDRYGEDDVRDMLPSDTEPADD